MPPTSCGGVVWRVVYILLYPQLSTLIVIILYPKFYEIKFHPENFIGKKKFSFFFFKFPNFGYWIKKNPRIPNSKNKKTTKQQNNFNSRLDWPDNSKNKKQKKNGIKKFIFYYVIIHRLRLCNLPRGMPSNGSRMWSNLSTIWIF